MAALSALQQDLEKAESNLKSVDTKIKDATGFDPNEKRPSRIVSRVGSTPGAVKRPFSTDRRLSMDTESPSAKRYRGADMAEAPLPSRQVRRTIVVAGSTDRSRPERAVQSSVVPVPRRSSGQSDTGSMARNRRMFGMLMGTLQKFKSDETTSQAQAQKQKEIDQRLEETRRKDREETVKHRDDLFRERREKTAAVNQLKSQIELAALQKEWLAHKDVLKKGNFILLKAQPPLFFTPAKHNEATLKLVEETHHRLDAEAEKRHEAIFTAARERLASESAGDKKARANSTGDLVADEDRLAFDAAADGINQLPGIDEASVDNIVDGGDEDERQDEQDAAGRSGKGSHGASDSEPMDAKDCGSPS